ncbi:hypothetical protein M8J75_008802 [Diaphorina citri]|nr:hypothetical protein M8J75_008802 [Diaphorina citri]KAI5721656.1 hypothetical protein M8J77_023541 [Diaphorina citri]
MVRSFTSWTKTLSFPARLNSHHKQQISSKENTLSSSSSSHSSDLPMICSQTKSRTPLSLTPDVSDSEKDTMGSLIHCIHYKEGCKWYDELKSLKGHLQTCKYDAIPCNKCLAAIPKTLMEDHSKFTCPERITTCQYCLESFSGMEMEDHTGHCSYEMVYCENKCGHKIQRRLMAKHRANDCYKRLVACRYCSKSYVADTLVTHQTKCTRAPIPCPNQCEMVALPREELDVHIKEHCNSLLVSCVFKDAGCRFKGMRGETMEKHIEENVNQHMLLMCSLVSKQQQQISTLKSALNKVTLNYSGTLIWKITDYSLKCQESIELLSPSFYTSQFGYKLQVSLFLNGNGAGEGTHVSVYIKLLPGEYDALLKWPFSHSVSFTLFDQSEKPVNVVESFVPDPTWENFQRPSKQPDSLGFGFPRFVSLDTIRKRQFLKDDAIFIRVKVDPSKIVAV